MKCPYCHKTIDIQDFKANPKRYFPAYGTIWHEVCVRKIMAFWMGFGEWIKQMKAS